MPLDPAALLAFWVTLPIALLQFSPLMQLLDFLPLVSCNSENILDSFFGLGQFTVVPNPIYFSPWSCDPPKLQLLQGFAAAALTLTAPYVSKTF